MSQASVDYRLGGPVVARLLGLALLILAVLLFAGTAVVALAGLPADVLVLSALALLVVVLACAWWLRSRAWVLRCTAHGYQVRLVRGAGATRAAWRDVEQVATSTRRGTPCLELRLRDGRCTTIPVGLLGVDREQFVREIGRRLT